jgi:hypothetical protein
MPAMFKVFAARPLRALAVSFATLLLSASAGAGVYRWVDDSGSVVYSQTPPPDGRPSTAVAPPAVPSSSAEAEQQQLKDRLKQADEARSQQQEAQKKQAEADTKDAERKRNCDAARQNLELIQNRPPQTRFRMPDGEYRRFTDEEREAELKRAREYVEKNCR